MYTATITKKEIHEQYDTMLLTVEFKSSVPIKEDRKRNEEEKKFDEHGKEKKRKERKLEKFETKTVVFKFPVTATFEEIKEEIKKKKESMEAFVKNDIPLNVPLEL